MLREMYVWLACLLTGASVASLALFCREWFDRALSAIEADIAEKLRRLRAPTRNLRRLLVFWLAGTVGVFCMFWLVLDSLVFGVLLTLFLVAAPWYLLRRMAEHRRQKIEDQLADAMVTLANAVRAGLSLAQSMEILAAQCPKPINAEFHQIVGEYKLGKPLDRTLTEAKRRLRSENFALFAAALLASHESGGRLNETVERIAQSVLEMQRLERKIQSETAQARKSAVYMALAPAFILTAYYFVDPDNTKLLFQTVFGQCLLALAIVFNVAAYLWARAILNPDI
ncbi:MAG: type II secretion system F family protein [Thermoguttaceae bacterium]|nr:type II secretion system F family protein [Thermoguttaceae bacterium]